MTIQSSNTMHNIWIKSWADPAHQEKKQKMFDIVDSYITTIPKNILDIGCGLAFESEMFQKRYGTELYLLDGDFSSTNTNERYTNYGSEDSMAFYSRIDDLKKSWKVRNIKFNFIDANNCNISDNLKFDLIYSFESCGFHYPLDTYINLLKKHTHENSVLIFDIRKKSQTEQLKNFEICDILQENKKLITASLRFKNDL